MVLNVTLKNTKYANSPTRPVCELTSPQVLLQANCPANYPTAQFTELFADKPTPGESSHGLVNSRTSQLTNSDFTEKLN